MFAQTTLKHVYFWKIGLLNTNSYTVWIMQPVLEFQILQFDSATIKALMISHKNFSNIAKKRDIAMTGY